jgi:hypothetical protein
MNMARDREQTILVDPRDFTIPYDLAPVGGIEAQGRNVCLVGQAESLPHRPRRSRDPRIRIGIRVECHHPWVLWHVLTVALYCFNAGPWIERLRFEARCGAGDWQAWGKFQCWGWVARAWAP